MHWCSSTSVLCSMEVSPLIYKAAYLDTLEDWYCKKEEKKISEKRLYFYVDLLEDLKINSKCNHSPSTFGGMHLWAVICTLTVMSWQYFAVILH